MIWNVMQDGGRGSPTFEARNAKSILLPSESTFLSNENLTTLPLSGKGLNYCCLKRFHHKDLFRNSGKRSVHDHDILFVLLPRKGTKRNIDYLHDKETVIMNTATNMGPIQVAALTYALCIIISMAVARATPPPPHRVARPSVLPRFFMA